MYGGDARVEGLYIASSAGAPMQSIRVALAEEGRGIRGDRYSLGEGTYSQKTNKRREISLISAEGIDAANSLLEEGKAYSHEETRRNIVTSGIDLEQLLERGNRVLKIGGAVLEVTDDCAPCHRPALLADKKGFRDVFADRGGVRAWVVQSGLILVGDEIIHLG